MVQVTDVIIGKGNSCIKESRQVIKRNYNLADKKELEIYRKRILQLVLKTNKSAYVDIYYKEMK